VSAEQQDRRESDPTTVTAAERRRAFDQIARHTNSGLDPRLLETIGRAALEEPTEGFEGERSSLALWIARARSSMNIEAEILARCMEALLLGEEDGTASSRLALGRAVAAFLLNDHAAWTVLSDRVAVREGSSVAQEGDGSIDFSLAAVRIRARRRSQWRRPL
jgi:hypothetical protein